MDIKDYINNEKKAIIRKISKIESMRKGTINEQIIRTTLKDGSVKENGPYYILTSKDSKGKTVTESVALEKLDFIKEEIENYREFKDLTNRYEYLSEQSSKIKSDGFLLGEKLKKNKRSK